MPITIQTALEQRKTINPKTPEEAWRLALSFLNQGGVFKRKGSGVITSKSVLYNLARRGNTTGRGTVVNKNSTRSPNQKPVVNNENRFHDLVALIQLVKTAPISPHRRQKIQKLLIAEIV